MKPLRGFSLFLVAGCLVFSLSAQAQPPGGARGPGARLRMFVPVEQMLGFLAFDEKIALSDEQLVKIRKELKGVVEKREEVAQEMQGGDRENAMEQIQALRTELKAKLAGVLNANQNQLLDEYLQRIQEMQQRFRQGGGRSGRRGGE